MKKLIAICAAALVTSAFAADSYLYWMIGESGVTWESGSATPEYTAARIGVTDSNGVNTYLSLYKATGGASIEDSSTKAYAFDSSFGSGTLAAAVSSTYQAEGYSFFIELLNDGKAVGRSNSSSTLNWDGLSSYISSTLGGTTVPSSSVWNGGTFTAAVPEPTSGLLMLFGISALALRRKRQA